MVYSHNFPGRNHEIDNLAIIKTICFAYHKSSMFLLIIDNEPLESAQPSHGVAGADETLQQWRKEVGMIYGFKSDPFQSYLGLFTFLRHPNTWWESVWTQTSPEKALTPHQVFGGFWMTRVLTIMVMLSLSFFLCFFGSLDFNWVFLLVIMFLLSSRYPR